MIGIPRIYKEFSMIDESEYEAEDLRQSAVLLLMKSPYYAMAASPMINIAMSFMLWTHSKEKILWRVKDTTTTEIINKYSIAFIPEETPKNWCNNCIVIESTDYTRPLLNDFFSITAYRLADLQGIERYFFVVLRYPDNAVSFSIPCNLKKINDRLIESGEFFSAGCLNDELNISPEYPEEVKKSAFDVIKFVFCSSYYFMSPERTEVTVNNGPPRKNKTNNKVMKKNGVVQHYWMYKDVSTKTQYLDVLTGHSKTLDKDHLSLEPVIVSPHIRRMGDRVLFIDMYDAHRWKSTDRIGIKQKI